jgi:3-methyl-2-oxobutanoate hydroxymethyltransferase
VADKRTILDFVAMKARGEKISVVTAYDFTFARLLDEAGADMLLVGDSLGTVIGGHETTLNVSMETMLYHVGAVVRGRKRAFVIGDMPFLSYQASVEEGVRNAGRLLQAGAEAVKLEGGEPVLETVRRIARADIPVMGHLGLTPQSVHRMGGYKVQGRDAKQAEQILKDAQGLEEAGAFALVLEGVPAALAARVTQALRIPTIGIGAGAGCDGQVLVSYDLLGLFSEFTPKFVKRYAELGKTVKEATAQYVADVKAGKFPGEEHTFH